MTTLRRTTMRRTFNSQSRFMKRFRLVLLISVVGTLPGLAAATSFASYIRAERRTNPWINLGDGHDVPTVYAAKAGLQIDLEHHLLKPTALASADFDEDGVPDLVSGYAGLAGGVVTLHRGNVDSL